MYVAIQSRYDDAKTWDTALAKMDYLSDPESVSCMHILYNMYENNWQPSLLHAPISVCDALQRSYILRLAVVLITD